MYITKQRQGDFKMEMREWRIGSLTLGLSLIITGITFIIFNIYGNEDILINSLNWWPVVLIILGCEILISNKLYLMGKINYKLDWVSVIFIFIILGFCFVTALFCFLIKNGMLHYL